MHYVTAFLPPPFIFKLVSSFYSAEGWNPSAGRKGWESWGCSAWGREGCGETLEQLPVLKECF